MFRRFVLRVFLIIVATSWLAVPSIEAESIHLTHSRLASFSIFCFEFCFPSDTFQVSLTLNSGPRTVPGIYTVIIGPAVFRITVNSDGTIAGAIPLNPFTLTVAFGPTGDPGEYDVSIFAPNNSTTPVFSHPITVTNDLVFDFLWTFLGIPATFELHPSIPHPINLTYNLETGPDPNPNPPAPPPPQPSPSPDGPLPSIPGIGPIPDGPNPPDPQGPQPPPCTTCPCKGMPVFSLKKMSASLTVTDTPLSYSPPRGPKISFHLTYNQFDPSQPASFTSSNLGPGWTFNWLTYITGGPVTGQAHVTRYVPGGGIEEHQGYILESLNPFGGPNGRILRFDPQPNNRSVMRAVASPSAVVPDTYQRTLGDGTIEFYENNAGGGTNLYLNKIIDAQGNTVTINYAPASAQILSITDALGQQTTFSYELPNDGLKITKVTDPFGRFATFTYDAQGRLASSTDTQGFTSTFSYLGNTAFLSSMTTPYGTTSFISQEGEGFRILEATDPLGQKQRVEYQASLTSIPATETNVPTGLTVNNSNLDQFNSFFWDAKAYSDAVSAGTVPGTTGSYAFAEVSHWTIAESGLLTPFASSQKKAIESRVWSNYQGQADPDHISPSGMTLPSALARVLDDGSTQLTQYAYNDLGRATQVIDPLGRQTNFAYSADGIDLLEATQKNGANNDVLFSATYNSQHLPLTVTDASGQATGTTYNSSGQLLTVTNSKGEVTTLVYDPNGFLLSVTGAIPGSTTTFSYDTVGRVKTATDSEGYTITNAYDNLDRLTKQTFPDGTFRQTVYDRLSLGSVTDRLGRTTTYSNDALGRPISVKDPLGRITNFTWCKCGSLATIQDPNGNVTSFMRDTEGRLVTKTYADNSAVNFAYTSSGSLKSRIDALGQVTSYQYSIDGNLASISYASTRNPTPNVNFTYDPVYNRRTRMTDGTGTTTFAYNPVNGQIGAGLLASVTGPLGNSMIVYSYDQIGRTVGRSINGNANSTSLTFDPLGRLTSETNNLGTFSISYVNQTARPLSLTYPNGQSTLYQYFDNLGDQRLKEIQNLGSGGTELSQFDYTYDAEGEILSWGQQTGAVNSFALGYDLAGQLTTAALTGATPKSFAYAYDPAGNRTDETINGASSPVTVNNLNELVARTGSSPLSFAYDINGSLLSELGSSSSPGHGHGCKNDDDDDRDHDGNAHEAKGRGHDKDDDHDKDKDKDCDDKGHKKDKKRVVNSANLSFQWDAENRLISITNAITNQQSQFTYDGLGRRVKIVELSGATVTATRNFVWDGLTIAEERDGSDNVAKQFFPQGQINGSTSFLYTRDHLGSIREVADGAGTLQTRYDYDPYGRRTVVSGADVADFGFTGHFFHPSSGLHLAPYRAYEADLATWLSRDPIGEVSGTNPYAYEANGPTNSIDPFGLWQITITGGLGLGGQITLGNNGGSGFFSGLINGQWNIGFKVGIGYGVSVDLDTHNSGCTTPGWLPELTATGELGAISHIQGQITVNDSDTPLTASLVGGVPHTPLYVNGTLDVARMHLNVNLGGTKGSAGASGFAGGGGTYFFGR